MPSTLLVETLLECDDLRDLYSSLPIGGAEALAVEKQIDDCEAILEYLRRRFSHLNRSYTETESNIGCHVVRPELEHMSDFALLRYGTFLKYICAAEANLADMPLEDCFTKLYEAQQEWHRRFGASVLAGSV